MLERISLAFQNVWRHKLRSFLTMLGIIIGIASIITIVSTIKGTNEQIKESLVGAGNNAVVVQLYQDNYPYEVQYNGVPAGVYPITEETRQELCKIDHVKGVTLFCYRNYADGVYYGNNSFSGNLYGIDEYYFDVNGYSLDHGRSFLKEDFAKAKKVCMLDAAAASALFSGEDPVGKTVEMQGDSFTVVGVVKRARVHNDADQNAERLLPVHERDRHDLPSAQDLADALFVRRAAVRGAARGQYRQYDERRTEGGRASLVQPAHRRGQNALLPRAGPHGAGEEPAGAFQLLQPPAHLDCKHFAARRRHRRYEHHARHRYRAHAGDRSQKAIGARRRRILNQFLTEAAVLTSLGGMLGVIVGIIMARLISSVMGTPTAISVPAILIAVVFSMVIGIVFGLLPAVKASNLNPIQALRARLTGAGLFAENPVQALCLRFTMQ